MAAGAITKSKPRRSRRVNGTFLGYINLIFERLRMKTMQSLVLFLAMLAFSLPAADSTNRLHFPVTGFSIAPLEGVAGETTRQVLMMFLPPNGNFAGNVNVQIQPYNGTIDEYMALTQKQFKDAGVKVIEQKKVGKSVVVFEYSGELQGQSLHWYARAEKSAGHVYLATATAAEQQWAKQGAQLKACVDSLRCERGE
jgi:hypothetical protein